MLTARERAFLRAERIKKTAPLDRMLEECFLEVKQENQMFKDVSIDDMRMAFNSQWEFTVKLVRSSDITDLNSFRTVRIRKLGRFMVSIKRIRQMLTWKGQQSLEMRLLRDKIKRICWSKQKQEQ